MTYDEGRLSAQPGAWRVIRAARNADAEMDARPTETTDRSPFAKHRVLLELGQGGMSEVYLAVARGPADFHKLVVLKILRADLAQDEAFRTMAMKEARIAARLNHPNVVQTYEVLNEGERPVIVMEYLEGQSLSSLLEATGGGTFTLAMGLQVLVDALSGLHHAHELSDYDGRSVGLVHRDFTPQNIFVGYDGHVKIIDFGIARTALAHGDETRAGTLKGKVRYMSPEQILGTPAVDRRADIFAAAMVLWELAAGEPPWKGASEIAVINHVINNELPSMPELPPAVAADIERICIKATLFDREKRYASAAEMAADLEEVLIKMNARVLSRDLGRVVCEAFGEARASTRRRVEEQLARWEREESARVNPPAPTPDLGAPPARLEAEAPRASPMRRLARQLVQAALLALTLAAVIALALLVRRHREEAARASTPLVGTSGQDPSASIGTAVPSPSSAPEHEVKIDVRAIPPSSVIYFDDQTLTNPATLMRTADGTRHTVRAEAPGYLTRAVEIVMDQGASLVMTLDRDPSAPSRQPPLDTGSSARPGAGRTDCSPPFYINAEGIKKFKPRCF